MLVSISPHFKIDGPEIRFGLSAIKNVGKAAIEAILESRENGEFASFADFLSRVDGRRVNKKVLESLIKVGAMSNFGGRASLLASMDELRNKIKSTADSQQGLFTAAEDEKVKYSADLTFNDVPEFSDQELQSLERQLLGLSLSAKPLSELLEPFSGFGTHKISELSIDFPKTETVKIAGVVSAVRVVVTKKSAQEMAFVKFQDETGAIDLVVFPKLFASTKSSWVDNTPFLIEGRVDAREESPSVLVESVKSTPTDTLFINIPKDTESEKLRNLKDLLLTYPGEQQVSLVFEGLDQTITLPFTITWSEGLSRLISDVLEGTPYSGVE